MTSAAGFIQALTIDASKIHQEFDEIAAATFKTGIQNYAVAGV
jgi:hypothetical protein